MDGTASGFDGIGGRGEWEVARRMRKLQGWAATVYQAGETIRMHAPTAQAPLGLGPACCNLTPLGTRLPRCSSSACVALAIR